MSKPSPRRPMHRWDEMSKATMRRDVQYTVETKCPTHHRDIKSQWKKRDRIYWNVQMTAATSWTKDAVDSSTGRTGDPAPVYPVGAGCTGVLAPEQYAVLVPASQVAPDAPVVPSWCTGESTISCIREHVKQPWRNSLAPVTPVVTGARHGFNSLTVARERSCTGWTEDKAPV